MRHTLVTSAALWLSAVLPVHAQTEVKIGFVTTSAVLQRQSVTISATVSNLRSIISAGKWPD